MKTLSPKETREAPQALKKCKVAFYVYPTAFQAPGGGEVQLLKTKEYLEKEGIDVTLLDIWNDKLSSFDLLHIFGSVKDCLPMMEAAKNFGVKTVLSTICWYSWKSAWGTYGSPKDRALALARQAAKSWFPFVPSKRKRMMQMADLLLPNSQTEADQIARYFQVPREKITVIPNGVEPLYARATPEAFWERYKLKDFVLCVGRIEPRKNQLNMIRALSGLSVPVVFIGDIVPNYQGYADACRREAGPNIHFLGALPHDSELLISAYAACDTFVLATWLETPGLAALEAGLAGAKIVITREGATREYFKDYAHYVSPDRIPEIREGTLGSLKAFKNNRLKQFILEHYLWQQAAQKIKLAYASLIHG